MPPLLLTFIRGYIDKYRYAPSRREMALAMGGRSTSVIAGHLRYLTRIGAIEFNAKRTRGISISNQVAIYFTLEEWHLMHAAWGDDIKENILEAAGQTRFAVTA